MALTSYASFSIPRSRLVQSPPTTCPFLSHQSHLIPLSHSSLPIHRPSLRSHNPRSLSLNLFAARDFQAPLVTGDSWDKLILESEVPVVVEFYASWCGPCRMVHRIIDEIATEFAGKVKCFVLDADHDLPIAENYDIKAVPVVLLFKNGQKRDSIIGTMPKEFYVAAIEKLLESYNGSPNP